MCPPPRSSVHSDPRVAGQHPGYLPFSSEEAESQCPGPTTYPEQPLVPGWSPVPTWPPSDHTFPCWAGSLLGLLPGQGASQHPSQPGGLLPRA